MENQQTRVLPSSSSSVARGPLRRSAQDGSWVVLKFSTHTGLMRIPLTNILRLSWWMLLTMPFAMIQGSTGSASLSTNTESFVLSHLLERSTGVFEEGDTCTTRHGLPGGQHGRGTKLFPSAGIGDCSDLYFVLLFLCSLRAFFPTFPLTGSDGLFLFD